MMVLYGAALGFGTMVVVLSFFGSHETGDGADMPVDLGADGQDSAVENALEAVLHAGDAVQKTVEAAADAPSAIWLLTSFRFWSFGLFAFGLSGVLLRCGGVPWDGLWAVLVGVGVGAAAALAFKRLRDETITSPVNHQHLAGQRGVVVVAVRVGQPGKVAVTNLAGRFELPASTTDPEPMPAGQQVTLVAVRGGVALLRRER